MMEEKSYITSDGLLQFIAIVLIITFLTLIIMIRSVFKTTTPVVPIRDRKASLPTISKLKREYNLLKEGQNHDTEIHASPIDENNMLLWKAMIVGPQDTPYENGLFNLVIEFSSDYPCAPPSKSRIVFISKMFHPNIYDTGSKRADPSNSLVNIKHGEVLLEVLRDICGPGYEIYFILKSIQTLLGCPNVVDKSHILNPEAAKLIIENYEEYENRVFECVEESCREDKTTDIQQYLDQAQTHSSVMLLPLQPWRI